MQTNNTPRFIASGLVVLVAASVLVLSPLGAAVATSPLDSIPDFGPQGHSGSIGIAHRGNSAERPENTLASLTSAATEHADYAEVDVRLSQDGVVVLMHDNNLRRTTNVETVFPSRSTDSVNSFSYAELQQLDAGSWFDSRFAGQKIPTLTQALDVVGSTSTGLVIELKINGVNQKVVDAFAAFESTVPGHPVAVASINAARVQAFHAIAPQVPTGIMSLDQTVVTSAELSGYAAYADFAIFQQDVVAASSVSKVHAAGLLALHNSSTRSWMDQSLTAGADGTMTDYPVRKYNQRISTTGRSYQAESFANSASHTAPLLVTDNTYLVGGKFSENEYLRTDANAVGQYVQIVFENSSAGVKEWELVMVKSDHFGIVDVSLDGVTAISAYDGYRPSMSRETVSLGDRSLAVGSHTLRFTVVGKTDSSLGYRTGFDLLASRPSS